MAELLRSYGADVHCLSKSNETPFNITTDTSDTELMLPQVARQTAGKEMDRGILEETDRDTQTELEEKQEDAKTFNEI